MRYWVIIPRSCEGHPRVTQSQNGKNDRNIHFLHFEAHLVGQIYIDTYYGLDPFSEYNYLLGLIIDDKDMWRKFSDDILSGAKLKVKVNFKLKYDFATNNGKKSVSYTSFSV